MKGASLYAVVAFVLIGGAARIASAAASPWSFRQVGELRGFSVPECVAVDPATGAFYVSNIESASGGYWSADGRAFITRGRADGRVDAPRWRSSTAKAALNAPKGMCVLGKSLFVADIARVVVAPLGEGKTISVPVPGARLLNDMATDGRFAYVSDTATGNIYRLDARGRVTNLVVQGPGGANGIAFHGNRMYAVSWDQHDIYEVDLRGLGTPRPFGLSRHFKSLDGIEALPDGTFVVSDNTGNAIYTVSPDRRTVTRVISVETPADIGLDLKGRRLLVPLFMKDTVRIYCIEGGRW